MPSPQELAREKIDNLSKCGCTLAANIQMATGLGRVGVSPASANRSLKGKTYTPVNFVYRLIKLAGARRVLFLVDRGNLGDQTLIPPHAGPAVRHARRRPQVHRACAIIGS